MNALFVAATIAIGLQRAIGESGADASSHSCDTYDCLADRLGSLDLNGPSLDLVHALTGRIVASLCALAVGCAICGALAPCWLAPRTLVYSLRHPRRRAG
eukprot:4525459-Pleurochrysis_carterae.AAC.2